MKSPTVVARPPPRYSGGANSAVRVDFAGTQPDVCTHLQQRSLVEPHPDHEADFPVLLRDATNVPPLETLLEFLHKGAAEHLKGAAEHLLHRRDESREVLRRRRANRHAARERQVRQRRAQVSRQGELVQPDDRPDPPPQLIQHTTPLH